MSSSQPPYPYFNGIEYNSAYFTSIDSGLTIAQANAKYLKKTVADTATAIETFSGGILIDAINPTTTTGTIQIGQTAINSNVEIAAQASRSTVLHLGDGNLSSGGIHIGNGAGSSNNINILNGAYTSGQTVGTVNILTGSNAAGSIGGNMNLFTTSRGTLTIGGTVNNTITVVKQTQFTNGTYSDKMDGIAASSSITIGGNLISTGSVTIGGAGTVTLSKPTISNPITPSYNPSTITTGQIGSSVTPTYNTPFNLSAAVVKNIATYSLPIGVYFIQANILTPTSITYQGLGISSASATIQYECWSNILTDTYIWFALNVSRVVVITTASTPYYIIAQAGDARRLLNVKTQCFRIA
jgi:hypothetical protein